MSSKALKYIFIILAAVLLLASCSITKKYQAPDSSLTNGLFRDAATTDTTSIATLSVNEIFTDTILQNLIKKGVENNLDVQIAYTRIQQAEAYYKQSRAAILPTLDLDAGATRSKLSEAQGLGVRDYQTQYQAGLSSAWELDVWGELRSGKRANAAELLRTKTARRAIQSEVVSRIASNYYTLLALDKQLEITEQTVRNWDTTVTSMRALKTAARVTEAAVVQSEAQRYAAEVTIPDLRQNIRETENALSILLGVAPAPIRRGNLDAQTYNMVMSTGLPAQLLSNRPDVQEAELSYRNAFELTNVARTAFYPALRISGSAGFSNSVLDNFLNPASFAASIGAGITQPIFNGRRNRTSLEIAKAQQQAALLSFKGALLRAGQEVSDAMSLHQTALDKMISRTNQVEALQKSVSYTQELLENAFANYNEVITARQSLLAAELGSINDKRQALQAIVDLYRALGGGSK
jgi:multidrug efflux system outer membrane protein